MTTPGTVRPGGRTARTADAVYAATVEELSTRSYPDISIETIAARAGVHKTTVYRRWGTKAELIAEALLGAASSRIQVPDTGNVETDLRELSRSVAAVLAVPQGATITTGLVLGALTSPELESLMSRFWSGRLAAISVIVERAIERGELPVGTDAAAVMHAVAAPLYYRLLVSREPVREQDADVSAAATYLAAEAGLFVQGGG